MFCFLSLCNTQICKAEVKGSVTWTQISGNWYSPCIYYTQDNQDGSEGVLTGYYIIKLAFYPGHGYELFEAPFEDPECKVPKFDKNFSEKDWPPIISGNYIFNQSKQNLILITPLGEPNKVGNKVEKYSVIIQGPQLKLTLFLRRIDRYEDGVKISSIEDDLDLVHPDELNEYYFKSLENALLVKQVVRRYVNPLIP